MIFGLHYGVWLILTGLYVTLFDKPARRPWQAPPCAWAGKVGLGIVAVGIAACAVALATG